MATVLFLLSLWSIQLIYGWTDSQKVNRAGFYEHSAHPIRQCKDELEEKFCKQLSKHCFRIEKVTNYCRKTCNDCPAVSPMICKETVFGCCWDGVTEAGPGESYCPECKDQSLYCKKYDPSACAYVWRTCPETCNRCSCKDDPNQAGFCPQFAEQKMCETDPELMKMFCKKTCNFCNNNEKKGISKSSSSKETVSTKRETYADDVNEKEDLAGLLHWKLNDILKQKKDVENVKKDSLESIKREKLISELKSETELEMNKRGIKNDNMDESQKRLLELILKDSKKN